MNDCRERSRVQDFLDGELPAGEARMFEAHLETCEACRSELASYRRVFQDLAVAALADPPPELTERVMNLVLPSRIRRRRRVAVWSLGYAGVLAACLVAALAWLSRPGTAAMMVTLWDEASRRVVHSMVFVVNALSFMVLSLANGWGLLAAAGQRLAILERLFRTLLASPMAQLVIVTAAASCIAVFWWMRPREKGRYDDVRHFGLLGF